MKFRHVLRAAGLIGLLGTLQPAAVSAETYPDKPIRLIMPFGAGSASDTIARIVSDKLGDLLGQRIIIENRAGAGGNIGTGAVARSPADGYTLIFAAPGPFVVNKTLEKLPYDPEKDFEFISPVATLVNVLVVNPTKIPVSNVQEFIRFVKERPGAISYSSVGPGSSQHLAAAYFDMVTGTRMVHVPYRSGSQLALDLVSGDVPVSFQLIPNVIAQIQSGEVKPLAVTTKQRSKSFPDFPTMAEAGVENYESYAWFGLAAPKGTPATVLARLSEAARATMADATVQKRLLDIGVEPSSSSPEAFRTFVSDEIAKWAKVIKDAGIGAAQ
ncbi:tripartite tricarboxylate transporter substrate binding protein [Bosea sp. TND4EK4]|uniref:Bug family tripartite tricarboxylate transporter substrate binding protein n=1 Tax=Bosea sp. TND4EK4 TaxID=1907408 RepID=UPI0009545DD6|nr:tripartite tricarboxylate transporter substrate binding protein [Bosea sp. TND4EK4]SIR43358.1 Tripartite-type tricarboxylate transporter, receptor component TctC [Bosea sp. TND4EK4]